MKRIVVDASVVAAAFFRERHAEAAKTILLSKARLIAPDLIHAEIASVIWKRRRRGEIDSNEAIELLNNMLDLPIEIFSSEQLIGSALVMAMQTDRTVYDCLYVALAMQEKATMISADRRLVNALAGGPLQDHVVWLGAES
jgi:predicted nucleic acid-binding protein